MSKIEAQLTASQATDSHEITKVVVAVHGIGSQLRYATVQSVAARFSEYCKDQRRPPLGSFHPQPPFTVGMLPFEVSKLPEALRGVGLAEVFWANIPQEAVKDKDTLEETKAWAKTVVARVRALDCSNGQLPNIDYKKTSAIVAEMVEAIGVVERLLFLADKAGLLKFDLASLLVDYLGDVQIVTEFADYRGKILSEFHRVMKELTERHPGVKEIYIIAHSEGTVVSFLGLLQALGGKSGEALSWDVGKVKGLMTIGSPIDKHIVMWPELWKDLDAPAKPADNPIQWRNYYDNGDPVGFELDTARAWLKENRWKSALNETKPGDYFDFTEAHDIGFTRYALPGKAHNDYWEDPEVFGHFVGEVIEGTAHPKPGSRVFAGLVSWVVPYILCLGLLFGGVYLMLKAGADALGVGSTGKMVFVNVAALTVLLGGMTVMSRIPRLTKFVRWHVAYTRKELTGLNNGELEKWVLDSRVDEKFQIADAFYRKDKGAFDKGHIVRREDAAWGKTFAEVQRANGDTYHVTNCSPQRGNFNQSGKDGIWGKLENFIGSQADKEQYCIFAGPVLAANDETFKGTEKAKIPSRFWKVVCAVAKKKLQVFAFILKQDLEDLPLEFQVTAEWKHEQVKLKDLEKTIGILRFPKVYHDHDMA
ncbi:MAG TPA: DNA/RNA non-specific endonuclease [Candidatus Saccharimonadales bacterium]|nr:DNA/RNA non-specific endonuclease [Candidatus Saccharimonadales bacterium]